MEKEEKQAKLKEQKVKSVNTILGIVDFCLAIYLIYNIIAMF